MTAAVVRRMEELYNSVIAPLVLGGELRPVRPIGPALAREMGQLASVFAPSDPALLAAVRETRDRRARSLSPMEEAPAMARGDVVLLAALNDLLQVANPHLRSALATDRPRVLMVATEATLSLVTPPRTVSAAVGRHATFARALSLHRADTVVHWWTGSATFRGEEPPARMLAWPSLRRVRVEERSAALRELASHTDVGDERFLRVVGRLLALSPLTDLATAHRTEPPFVWSRGALALVRSPVGAATARRVMAAAGARGDLAIERAISSLDEDDRDAAGAFLAARRAHAALSP